LSAVPAAGSTVSSIPSDHRVNRRFLVLGLGEVLARLIGFAATVWAIRALGASTFGLIGVAAAVTLYCNRVADLGFDLGLGVREIAADSSFLDRIAPSVLGFRTLLGALLAVVLAMAGLLFLPQPDGAVVAVYGLTLLAVGLNTRWIHLGADRSRIAAAALTAGQLFMALLVLALVRGPGDVTAVAGAQVAGDLLAAGLLVVALGATGRTLTIRVDWKALKPILPRAWALVASALLGILIYNADFIFLRVLHGSAAVGYYAAGYTLVTFFLNIGIAYNLSLLPSLTRLRGSKQELEELYHTSLAQVFAVGVPAAVGGSLLAAQITGFLFGPGYAASAVPFALLIWSIPLNLLRDVPLMALLSSEGERWVFRVTLWAAVLNFALNIALIPSLGTLGAALATVATEAVRMVLAAGVARAHGYRLPGLSRFMKAGLATGAMAGCLLLLPGVPVYLAVPAGGAVYLVVLAGLGGIRVARGQLPALSV